MPQTPLLALITPLLISPPPLAIDQTSAAFLTDVGEGQSVPAGELDRSGPQSEPDVEQDPDDVIENDFDLPEGDQVDGEEGNEIVVEGSYGPPENDPLERMNAESFRITQSVDRTVVAPLAYAYEDGLPEPIRDGLRNAVRNIGEPNNALNFLLQLKVGKAFETLGRFAINSTLGLGGLFDVAGNEGIDLPYRRNGFANTMGYYGIGPGPYLVLPLTGSTSVRDVIGSGLDQALLPVAVGAPFNQPEYGIPVFVVSSLQSRLEIDEQLERANASDDPYASMREGYLGERAATIQEFKEGSPLQGIPEGERPYTSQQTIDIDMEAGEPTENTSSQSPGAQFDPAQRGYRRINRERIVLTQSRETRYRR